MPQTKRKKPVSKVIMQSMMTKAGIWVASKEMCTNLVQQDDDYGCAIAALAMALGITYAKARREVQEYWDAFFPFHPYKGMDKQDEDIILFKHGYKTLDVRVIKEGDEPYKSFHDMLAGRRALLSVPSINIPGLYHALFWDGKKLHDPSKLKTYTAKKAWRVVSLARVLVPLERHELFGISKNHRTDTQNS